MSTQRWWLAAWRPGPCALAAAALVAFVACWSSAWNGAESAQAAGRQAVPLESLVPAQAFPGFTAVGAGPTNGPLTATEFASQSSNPHQAETQFAALAAEPGFAAFIRLWTDRGGSGDGANDLAVLLFRIPDAGQADAFTTGLLTPFDRSAGARPFTVPSIAGAHGYSIPVTAPVHATEQVVVFHAGPYVSMLELASTTSASNRDPLTSSEAITASFQQYQLLRLGDPAGTAPSSSGAPTRAAAAPVSPAPAEAPASGGPPIPVLVAAIVLAAVAVVLGVLSLRRRRRAAPDPEPVGDPWGPEGIFALFGALDPLGATDGDGPGDDRPDIPAGVRGAHSAQTVPALAGGTRTDTPGGLGAVPHPVRS